MADDRHAVLAHHFADLGQRAVTARLGGKVDDHRAGLHRFNMVLGDQHRRRPPRDQGGGDDNIHLGDGLGHQVGLLAFVVVGHFLGVAAVSLGLQEFLVLDRHKCATQALDLFLGGRSHIGRRNHRAQTLGGGDGLKTGDTDPHDEGLRRHHAAGRRRHHRHRPAIGVDGVKHGFIAGDIGLARQHVH